MAQLFNNKYRISTARLQNWNYANEGMYFITICIKNRENYFGEIVDTILQPTNLGKIAHSEWFKSMEMRPDMNLELGEFVVMPNHIHGIIIIGENEFNTQRRDAMHCHGRDAMHCVSTMDNTTNEYKNQFAPQSKNLSSIIRGYKSAVTTYARKNGIEFEWQPRFHDHIMRSMDDYHRISNYIINNPVKWQEDKFYAI
ncbi:MAG: transposase [Chitinophagales bacterium]